MSGAGKLCVAGVIPARWGSTRFSGKSLALIAGKPLVQRVYEQCLKAGRLDRLLVATDDERIAGACRGFGAEAVMTRSDHPSGTDRIAEAVEGVACDVVINIQGDEPLIDPALIDSLGDVFAEDGWDMATAACPLTDWEQIGNPSVVKVVTGPDGRALYFSRSVIPHPRDGRQALAEETTPYWRHVGIYAYRADYLRYLVGLSPSVYEDVEKLEQLRALQAGCRMKVVRVQDAGVGVDTPEDVARAEAAIQACEIISGGC